jgi:hypothetical protein
MAHLGRTSSSCRSVHDDPCDTLLWSSVIWLLYDSAFYQAYCPLREGNVSVHMGDENRVDTINLFTGQSTLNLLKMQAVLSIPNQRVVRTV